MFPTQILLSLFVEIFIPRHKNMVIGVIYRPRSENTLEFKEKVNEIISVVTKGNKHCYVTGDFNLDLLNPIQSVLNSLNRFLPLVFCQ